MRAHDSRSQWQPATNAPYPLHLNTRTSAPWHTPHGQPAARSEALAPPEALAKDRRAKGHGAVKASPKLDWYCKNLCPGESEASDLVRHQNSRILFWAAFVCQWRTATGRSRNSGLGIRKSSRDPKGPFWLWSGAFSTGVRGQSPRRKRALCFFCLKWALMPRVVT